MKPITHRQEEIELRPGIQCVIKADTLANYRNTDLDVLLTGDELAFAITRGHRGSIVAFLIPANEAGRAALEYYMLKQMRNEQAGSEQPPNTQAGSEEAYLVPRSALKSGGTS
jgi:hypothetical protein